MQVIRNLIVLLQALVLTNINGVELTRVDLNGNRVRVDCVVDLVVGEDFKVSFHVHPNDVATFKNGTVAEKNAIRKNTHDKLLRTILIVYHKFQLKLFKKVAQEQKLKFRKQVIHLNS